jgi:pimeloyl-ACP methyl ester carboxylesterase
MTLFALSLAAPAVAQPPPPDTELTTASAERFRPARIDWSPCPENPAAECGTLTLPVDYDEPWGETFELAVARSRATDPARRIGLLLTNPGGPGLSGVDFLMFAVANAPVFAPYRERFDIVSFDPRGVGRSRPIECVPGPSEASCWRRVTSVTPRPVSTRPWLCARRSATPWVRLVYRLTSATASS